ncbi:MAG: SDR family oxidoreductase [Candidatus Rokubacteria bacterium]|nr:SDR family oxidoreductase [Candidatus Rokubacteria bacterium]
MKLGGKIALVTGGGNGMGRAYCHRLAGEGATVVVADIDRAAAERVVGEIREAAVPLEVDITSQESVTRAVRAVLDRHPGIDILVNNAGGAAGERALLVDTDLDTWNANLLLNLTGTFLMCREVIPSMRTRGYGKIINVCSGSVFSGITAALFVAPERRNNLVPYLAAKGGILGLTRALAREVGEWGIRVNAVAPGYTLTERAKRTLAPEAPPQVLERQIFRRPGTPEDPAGAVVFLASPDSDFMTGQTICVDGGWVAH